MSSLSNTRKTAWAVWIIGSIFYAYQYILRVMPNVLIGDILHKFDISAAAFGQFSGVYYIGYALMHLPLGIMLDRIGPKKVMTGCILLTVAGLLPLIFSDYWLFPIFGRFLMGMGSSGAILGVFKILRLSFTEAQFPRLLSFSVMIGLIGAIWGGIPISYLREVFGFQAILKMLAFGGVALAALTYWIIPNLEKTPSETPIGELKEVLSSKKVIATCFLAGCMVGPMEGFADVWATLFLKQVFHFDGPSSAGMPSLIFIGMCFGAPILNLIAEKTGYLKAIAGAGIAMILCFIALLAFTPSSLITSISFLVLGVASAYQILAIYKASTYVREEVAGLTTAVANMVIMLFGYAFHTLIGTFVNLYGGPNNPAALEMGILVIPVGLAIGTLGFALFPLVFPKRP